MRANFTRQSFINKLSIGLVILTVAVPATADVSSLKALAAKGDAEAQYELAGTYRANSNEAFDWYQKAANQGDAKAQTAIGSYYSHGSDLASAVPQDYFKALEWFSKAAAQGEASAQYNLGHLYNRGSGVRLNKIQAQEFYGQACDNGKQEGCDEYKKLNK